MEREQVMRWFYHDGKEQIGPVDNAEMIKLAESGVLRKTTQVWKEGTPAWIVAASSELSEHLLLEPPPMPLQPGPTDGGAQLGQHRESSPVMKEMSRRNALLLAWAAGISVFILMAIFCALIGQSGPMVMAIPFAGVAGSAVYAKLNQGQK